MFCSNCGEEIDDESKFCKNCGCSLIKDEVSEKTNDFIDSGNNRINKTKHDKKSDSKKGGILIGICCLGIILIALFVGFNSPDKSLIERPLMVDDDGHKIVSVNVTEDYVWGTQPHSLQHQLSEDDYEVIRALNCSNKTDLTLFNDILKLCKSGSPLNYKSVNYYKVDSNQKLENRAFNHGLKVKNIDTCLGYTYNNDSKVAVVVMGTGGSHVAETISHVNFY